MNTPTSTTAKDRKWAMLALFLLVPLPSIGTLAAMIVPATRGTALGQGIYAFSKVWILILPLVWHKFVDKQRFTLSPLKHGGMAMGWISGLVIFAVILGAYYLFGQGLVDQGHLREQARGNGITSPAIYLGLFAYLALVNALLEEYVWRWFVYRKSELLFGSKLAVAAAAAFFTLHHVFALKAQFGLRVTILGSLGVFTGSLIWSYLYRRYQSIWPGYVSHIMADLAIAVIGWQLLF